MPPSQKTNSLQFEFGSSVVTVFYGRLVLMLETHTHTHTPVLLVLVGLHVVVPAESVAQVR